MELKTKKYKIICISTLIIFLFWLLIVFNHIIIKLNGKLTLSVYKTYSFSGSSLHDKDLIDLKYCKKTTDLSILNSEITNIEFISNMPNLSHLAIESSNILDLSKLSNCNNLTSLYLCHTKLVSLDCLQNNIRLETLDLYTGNNRLSDISALKHMSNLKSLSISSSKIQDFEVIGELATLEYLELVNTHLSNLQPILSCSKIKDLNLCGSKYLTNIDLVSSLCNLEKINLASTSVVDYSPLLNIKNLKEVFISNGATDYVTIEKLIANGVQVTFI